MLTGFGKASFTPFVSLHRSVLQKKAGCRQKYVNRNALRVRASSGSATTTESRKARYSSLLSLPKSLIKPSAYAHTMRNVIWWWWQRGLFMHTLQLSWDTSCNEECNEYLHRHEVIRQQWELRQISMLALLRNIFWSWYIIFLHACCLCSTSSIWAWALWKPPYRFLRECMR